MQKIVGFKKVEIKINKVWCKKTIQIRMKIILNKKLPNLVQTLKVFELLI